METQNPADQAARYRTLPPLAPDIDIAHAAELRSIDAVARDAGIDPADLEHYGKYKAKIAQSAFEKVAGQPDGKLVLVTAITATRAGEGKTVTCIGLSQGLARRGVKQMLALREPSLGPTFGIKGGAAGGGHAQVLPMEDINIHFTGDLHAVTSAHNLLTAVLDNHIHHGNELGIDLEKIVWRRVIDLCDRQLRFCEVGRGTKFDGFPHHSGFDITASSEVMAVLALAEDIHDLERRLGEMIVAYTHEDEPVFASQLDVVGSMVVLLREALQPNLVQTTEGTPALIHCGPFANIAHGCNSVRATRLALKLADVVVTEAGFAADLGAEKFCNIKCRMTGMKPDVAVLVVTCRALKMHGGAELEMLGQENIAAVRAGLENARTHIENLRKFGLPVVVAINRFPSDTPAEMDAVFEFCQTLGVRAALSEVAALGGAGGEALADAVMAALAENDENGFELLYACETTIKEKIETIAREIYRADGVDYTEAAEASIARLERLGMGQLPICMAKTQLSISDDPKRMNAPRGWRLTVRGVKASRGAGFLVALTGKLLLMPGMPKRPATEKIGIDDEGNIVGLS